MLRKTQDLSIYMFYYAWIPGALGILFAIIAVAKIKNYRPRRRRGIKLIIGASLSIATVFYYIYLHFTYLDQGKPCANYRGLERAYCLDFHEAEERHTRSLWN
ncbi:hypothetical protein CFELI_09870 [Corynebacterium felinum]|uniref:Glucan phosphoethanolaminetransferase (Alkaline phosphatase superfamily) n=1 Tax=Corynebacterium felinum TaxID=131318 RepID=A0ABU2BCB4_9CORY|nr:glucan phosphoethanolaminetransferase (alkaline phosphatase superfamily) [Corynebacterium felinum]WJY95575.1 hypothetical protein CFELI_09870 [Corynebacterium felinum]